MEKDIVYQKEDIKKYKNLKKLLETDYVGNYLLNITYEVPFNMNIDIPNALFSYILTTKRPELIEYTQSFKIIVNELIKGNNPWLKRTKKLGLYDETTGILNLKLDLNIKHKEVSILWILFHEFRHHIQFRNINILSCLDNKNREMWLNYYGKNIDTVKHVFHEIDPLEVDANTFACEILDIPYPNSKFSITENTLKRLK
jgi:hypothetical protein